jgi:2-hydroxy-6-oxonona-2,4-dienedioate hydrolase
MDPSAMLFALRHPERTSALILLVPAAFPAEAATNLSPLATWMTNTMLRSNLLFWLALRLAHGPLARRPGHAAPGDRAGERG